MMAATWFRSAHKGSSRSGLEISMGCVSPARGRIDSTVSAARSPRSKRLGSGRAADSSSLAASSICSTIVFTWFRRSSSMGRTRSKVGVFGLMSPSRISEM